jgi:hypothetical protein
MKYLVQAIAKHADFANRRTLRLNDLRKDIHKIFIFTISFSDLVTREHSELNFLNSINEHYLLPILLFAQILKLVALFSTPPISSLGSLKRKRPNTDSDLKK